MIDIGKDLGLATSIIATVIHHIIVLQLFNYMVYHG